MEKLNNKKLGSKFEKDFMELLAKKGYWVTFLEGKANIGSQPCDIIAIRRDNVELYDCKTLANKNGLFPISRIEENQRLAFERLRKCRNPLTVFALSILWNNNIYIVDFDDINFYEKSIDLKKIGPILEDFYEDNSRQ